MVALCTTEGKGLEAAIRLAQDLMTAYGGDGSAFSPNGSSPNGAVDIYSSFSPHASTAVSCLDSDRIESFKEYQQIMDSFDASSLHTKGVSWASVATVDCIGWPFEATNGPKMVDTTMTCRSGDVLLI